MKVEVHIERLVLEGFSGLDRQRVGVAVERTLRRGLAIDGLREDLLAHGGAARVEARSIALPVATSSQRLGAAIGKAVHGGLTTEPEVQR